MSHHEPSDATPAQRRQRIVEQLDHMVASGRLTQDEADRLRASTSDEDFNAVINGVRHRHAEAKLTTAVEAGEMTSEEAAQHLADLDEGQHDPALRARLRGLS